jgi:hypothetical protein
MTPIATPAGVVSPKIRMLTLIKSEFSATAITIEPKPHCEHRTQHQDPNNTIPIPSKNWWNVIAINNGTNFTVAVPRDVPSNE